MIKMFGKNEFFYDFIINLIIYLIGIFVSYFDILVVFVVII